MDQQKSYTIRHKYLSLQIAKKMTEIRSTNKSHRSCISVHVRHLYEMGTLPIEFISRGLQGCIGARHRVPLIMDDYSNSLHGMVRTKVCNFLY
jgi:hypothetical protein